MDDEDTFLQHLMYRDVKQIWARQFDAICKHWTCGSCVSCVSCVSTNRTRRLTFKVCRGQHFDWIFAISLSSCLSFANCPASQGPLNASPYVPHPASRTPRTRHWPGWPCTFWTHGLVIHLHSTVKHLVYLSFLFWFAYLAFLCISISLGTTTIVPKPHTS